MYYIPFQFLAVRMNKCSQPRGVLSPVRTQPNTPTVSRSHTILDISRVIEVNENRARYEYKSVLNPLRAFYHL
jgi:hypothetical protein